MFNKERKLGYEMCAYVTGVSVHTQVVQDTEIKRYQSDCYLVYSIMLESMGC